MYTIKPAFIPIDHHIDPTLAAPEQLALEVTLVNVTDVVVNHHQIIMTRSEHLMFFFPWNLPGGSVFFMNKCDSGNYSCGSWPSESPEVRWHALRSRHSKVPTTSIFFNYMYMY